LIYDKPGREIEIIPEWFALADYRISYTDWQF